MRALLAALAALVILTLAGSALAAESTVYVSPSGSDGAACTQSAPCKSFARAASVVADGGTVEVTPGTYPAQFYAAGAGSSQGAVNKTITFRGQPGNKVRGIHIGSGSFTFDGLTIDLDGASMAGGTAAFENGGASVTFKNGSIGDTTDSKAALVDGPSVVFDNVDFHDVVLKGAGVHTECIQALWVPGFTVRNSTFTNCAVMDISLGYPNYWDPAPPPYDGVVIEGNTFNAPVPPNGSLAIWSNRYTGSCSTGCDWGAMHNYVIRNNHFASDGINRQYADSTTVVCGNTGATGWLGVPNPSCSTPPPPPPSAECADGQDNDGDGKVDSADAGCSDAADNDESDDPAPPPPPPGCDAACEQAYQDQIAALQAQVASLTTERDAAVAARDSLRAKLDEIHALSAP